jgi:Cellulase (glycosyl hydrolase family 5)
VSSALKQSAHARIAIAAGLLVALIAMLSAAPKAHAAKGMEVALEDDGVLVSQQYFNREQALDMASQLNVSRIRVNMGWTSVLTPSQQNSSKAPSKPTYDFSKFDGAINAITARGIKVTISITRPTPRWAAGDKKADTGKGTVKPNAKLYGKFFADVITHYKSNKLVDIFSAWNEPNHKGWIQSTAGGSVANNGTIYRGLFTEAYKQGKKANPKAIIAFGELAPYPSKAGVAQEPLKFLRQAFCLNNSNRPNGKRCPTLKADAFAYHPYDFAQPPNRRFKAPKGVNGKDVVTIANLGDLTKMLDALKSNKRLVPSKGSFLPIYLTEYGYFASRVPGGKSKVFPEATRAKYLVQAFTIAQKNPRVKSMLQFLLIQYPGAGTASAPFDFDTSIAKLNGTPTKSFTSLKSWATNAVKKKLVKKGGRR